MKDLDIEIKIGIPIRSDSEKPFKNGHYVTSTFEKAIYLGTETNEDTIEKTVNHEVIHALLDLEFGKNVCSWYDNNFFFPNKASLSFYSEFGDPQV